MPIYALGESSPQLPETGNYWIAPDAQVMGNIVLLENASVWFAAVLRGDNETITIGENSNVQDGSILHTDIGFPLTLGKNITVGHQAMLHGCTVGDNSLVGIGATILNGAKIGKNCLIGAHALVGEGKEIPDNSMVLGMPGKIVRELGEDNEQMMIASAMHYVENWQRYKRDLKEIG
ncbi:MAG: gamma carbonic anhydrase family protein [Rhodobiaceae bacterium]|jgi:carbonic anhydrase/acetyltransferase-like protein (isoleucine patch superfamily)|nr:gamma carbonic anhydrase family protein [Rhodobiaceae bacterium]MBT5518831.1 gamma carbonic anhydrase family protein [Rhodobiaceae bacterium]MBT7279262.1 gamma carbonic anhydrase family protein [Rhodobiaceae bacterium]MDG2496050.1 gamma carbonic anhydrase family protein [Alphaproteobacteria bacterium]